MNLKHRSGTPLLFAPFAIFAVKKILPSLAEFPQPPGRMAEQSIADLLALDTATLKGRLSELRRYL